MQPVQGSDPPNSDGSIGLQSGSKSFVLRPRER